jgi:glutamine amidotransferase
MIGVVDVGIGNLRSVLNALAFVGADVQRLESPDGLLSVDKILLPGVGAFSPAMRRLQDSGFRDAILQRVRNDGVPILGICLGMQLLARYSTEGEHTEGLGLVNCVVEGFDRPALAGAGLKIPHVGFDTVAIAGQTRLLAGLGECADFYFTHSYRMACAGPEGAVGCCTYGETFVAAVETGHIAGTQFHPEKSQGNGLAVLRNFIEKF